MTDSIDTITGITLALEVLFLLFIMALTFMIVVS